MDNKASDEAAVAASQANVREHDYSATTSSPNAIVKPASRVPCVPSATVSRTSAKVTASPSPAVTSLLASKRFNSILSRLVRDNHDRIIIKQNKEGGERPTYVQISVRNKKTPQPTPQEPTSDGVERPIPTTKSHINIIEVPPNIESSMLNQTDVPSTIKIVPVQVQRSVVSILKDPICNSESVTEQPKRIQSVVIEKEPPKLHNKISVKEVIRRKKEDLVARMYPNPDMIQSDLQSALNLAHFLPVSPPNLCSTGKESATQKVDVTGIKIEDSKINTSSEEPNIKVSIKVKQENIKTSAKSRLNRETDKDIGIKQEPIDPPKMKTKKPAFPLKVKLKERKKSNSQKAKSNACTTPKTTPKQGSKNSTVKHIKQEASVSDYEDEKEIGNLEIVEKPLAKRQSIPTAKAKSAKNALKQTSPRQKSAVKVKTSSALAVQGKPNQKKRKRQKTLSKTKSVTSMMKEDSSPEITSTKKRPKGNNSPDDHLSSTEPILGNPDITETSLDSSGPLITITGFSESMEATPEEILDHLESIDIKGESNSNEEQPSLNKNTTTAELEDSEPEPAKASDYDLTTNASDNGPTTNASDNGPTIRFEIISNSNHEKNPLAPSTEIHVITTVKDSNASGDEPRARTSLIKSEPTTPVSTPTKGHLHGAEGGAARLQLCARTSLLRRIFAERGEGSQSHVMIPLPKQELSAEEEQEAQIDMKALDEKIKRMIDREVEEVEGPAAGEGGERVRAVRFKHRERERQRRKSVPNSPSSAHPPRKPRSHSASDTAVGLAPQNATATPDAEEEKTPRRTQHVEEFPAVASSSYESAGDLVAQSQSHPSLPERPRSPEPARRSQSQPAIGSRAGAKVTIEAKLAQAYSHMLAAWSDYIHMDAEQMRQAEIQNATYFQYTDESLDMIKDEDLYVWQLVEDLAKPYSIATL